MPDDAVTSLTELVARSIAGGDGRLERAILGTSDPAEVARRLESHVAGALSAPLDASFYRTSVGIVAGLTLTDGSAVVLKVHRWHASIDRLTAIQVVQAHLAASGLPAPRPLAPPMPLGEGVATIESFVAGQRPTGTEASVRATIATGLHAFIDAARPLRSTAQVGAPLLLRPAGTDLWHEPHDVRFDFDATSKGAAWIDRAARSAQRRLHGGSASPVIGHFDWRVENLGVTGPSITAIYDWDAVGLAAEPVVVGVNAAQFCSDWTRDDADTLPTVVEMRGFVEDYETARGGPFSLDELRLLDAANLWTVAYGARCQHADAAVRPTTVPAPPVRWHRLLVERGEHVFDHPGRRAGGAAEA